MTSGRRAFVVQCRCRLAGCSAGVSARTAKGPRVQWEMGGSILRLFLDFIFGFEDFVVVFWV